MPNYCYNTLTVSGDEDMINKFDDQFATGGIDLDVDIRQRLTKAEMNAINLKDYLIYQIENQEDDYSFKGLKSIRPLDSYSFSAFIPPNLSTFQRGWYDWRVEQWGTKWDAAIDTGVEINGDLSYQFDTAWSPPIPVINQMIQSYPELSFRFVYVEEGPSYAGIMEGKDGVVTVDKYEQDNVNKFLMDELDYVFYACPGCGELISEDYIDDEECYSCECKFEYDSSSNTLVKKEKDEEDVETAQAAATV